MTEITLGAEQARFAAELVARGRYRDVAEVVAAALAELERAEMAATAPASEPPRGAIRCEEKSGWRLTWKRHPTN
ncbi:MAG: type II toxin-antitoxin system ParD family antitoxin [Rhodospirillales bacterium]